MAAASIPRLSTHAASRRTRFLKNESIQKATQQLPAVPPAELAEMCEDLRNFRRAGRAQLIE